MSCPCPTCRIPTLARVWAKGDCMNRINLIQRAFVSTLSERAVTIFFARATGLPTFKTQPKSASTRNYKAGVSIPEILSAELVYSLFPTLRDFGKVFSATREFDHNRVNARRGQFSRWLLQDNLNVSLAGGRVFGPTEQLNEGGRSYGRFLKNCKRVINNESCETNIRRHAWTCFLQYGPGNGLWSFRTEYKF